MSLDNALRLNPSHRAAEGRKFIVLIPDCAEARRFRHATEEGEASDVMHG